MALQAEQIHIVHFQHVLVGAAVRKVARLASFDLLGRVLKNEWPFLISMAGETDGVLGRGSPNLLGLHSPVGIVAIAALNQAFIHPMMKRHVELGFLLEMA